MKELIIFAVYFFSLTANSTFADGIDSKPSVKGSTKIKVIKNEATTAEREKPFRLGVLSYNIHHARGVDGQLNLARIANVILSVKPDLVALQEVDNKTNRTGKIDQAAELSRLTKMFYIFGSNIEFQGGHYGNAILSRFPVVKKNNLHLPNLNSGEQRGVLESVIKLSKEQKISFLATHLDHRKPDNERIASAKFINERISLSNKIPAILAGDFNDIPFSSTLKEFGKLWLHTNATLSPTIPVSKPTRQIDYIMIRPKKSWRVIRSKVLDEAVASDHRAIFAEIELVE